MRNLNLLIAIKLFPLLNRLGTENYDNNQINKVIQDTSTYIFVESDIDFCLRLINSFNEGTEEIYIKYESLNRLRERFLKLGYGEQMKYGLKLMTFFELWKKYDSQSFCTYSSELLGDESFDYHIVLSSLVDQYNGRYMNLNIFNNVFKESVPVLLSRMRVDKDRDRTIEKYLKEHKDD